MTPKAKDRAKEKDPDGRDRLKAKDRAKDKEPDGRPHDLGSARSASHDGRLRTTVALSPVQQVSEPHSHFGIEAVSRSPIFE